MNNIKIINFAKSFVDDVNAKFFNNPNQKIAFWGAENNIPAMYLKMYDTVPEHTSAINFIETNIVAKGIDGLDYWDTKKITLDFTLFGGFAFQVIKQRGGGYSLEYVDISKCRYSIDKKKIAYSENWDNYKPEIVWNEITDSVKKEGIFIFKSIKSRGLYPVPHYMSSTKSLDTMSAIIDYHNNNARTGFAPNVIINFNDGEPTDEVKGQIEKSIKEKYTGETGQKFILSFNQSVESKATVEKLDNDNLDQKFETLQKFIQNQIIVAHQITSGQLIGVKADNQGFSKTEYEEAMVIFKDVIIKGFREEIEYGLGILLGKEVKFKDVEVV